MYNLAQRILIYREETMTSLSTRKAALITALMAVSLLASTQVQLAQQPGQQPAPGAAAAAAPRGGGRGAIDPRVQQRTYTFKDTNEEIPYAVFVSSKVSKDKKNPLIVALHGLGGNQNTMMGANALQLAEEGGYIMVGPMGYNSSGWYGAPSPIAGGTGGAAGALDLVADEAQHRADLVLVRAEALAPGPAQDEVRDPRRSARRTKPVRRVKRM
jgi:poly(3-hydroxybutyrate) depolymerase